MFKEVFKMLYCKVVIQKVINSLPNNKNFDQFDLKAFADDKIWVTKKLKFAWESVENIVGKGKKADL